MTNGIDNEVINAEIINNNSEGDRSTCHVLAWYVNTIPAESFTITTTSHELSAFKSDTVLVASY